MILKINLTNISGKKELVILNNVAYFDEITTSKENTLIVFNGAKSINVVETIEEINSYIDVAIKKMSKLFTPDINISNNVKNQPISKQVKGIKTEKVKAGSSNK